VAHPDLSDLDQAPPAPRAADRGVLVVGVDEWAIRDAVDQLRAAGLATHRCTGSGEAAFPCNAMVPGRGCPLDQHDVGVVLDVRHRPSAEPTWSEMGAVCGLRAGIPLVTAGVPGMDGGFGPWARRVPPFGDIVTSCDDALQARR